LPAREAAGRAQPSPPVAIARATVERRLPVQTALNAHGGQGGYVDAIACPDGIRGGAATCQSGIDKAGAGLALLAVSR